MNRLGAALLSSVMLAGSALAAPSSHHPAPANQDMTNQDTPDQDGSAPMNDNAALLRQNNITSTGATIPHPGASQSSGPTPLDHDIERLNDRIERSICKGC